METRLKRRWIVKWYEFNLTEEKCRKFFTEGIANLYAWYTEYTQDVKTRVYRR